MTEFTQFQFSQIGIVYSPYREKFAIPRQPGLAMVDAVIELMPPFAQPDAVYGLEQFSHIWVTFIFHALSSKGEASKRAGSKGAASKEASEPEWKPLVRPPRLGGNEKLGVFATRSTHRPNPLGLSVVELLRVEIDNGVRLHIRGADLLDGTPVIDIKPYIPYADSHPHARAGFAQLAPSRMHVRWQHSALLFAQNASAHLKNMIEEILSFDPRPAYQDEQERIYGVHIDNYNVRFRIGDEGVEIIDVAIFKSNVG